VAEDIVVSVRDLSKIYKIYHRPLDMLLEVITGRKLHQDFWALQDVSFDVAEGEILGIIGRNGAGKSTLLKILSGTLDKTAGEVSIAGKISAILELGTGFHPEYSGRENIYLGGLCLGMSREEIDKKIDDIIDFSELAQFIEQPLKTYSSGMQGRLAFSVAMSVDPDILIIDEALATGDILFQEKCFRRIQEICRKGKAVLLVTHSLHHIYEVCTKCMLLHNSMLIEYGEPRKVGDRYERLLAAEREETIRAETSQLSTQRDPDTAEVASKTEQAPGGHRIIYSEKKEKGDGRRARVISLQVLNANNVSVTSLIIGQKYKVVAKVSFFEDMPSVNIGFRVQKETGLVLIGDTTYENGNLVSVKRGETVTAVFEFVCRIGAGSYFLGGGVTEILPDGSYSVCHMVRGNVLLQVDGKRLNALVDPACEISITKNAALI
jgi:lipopolysaccharide transport system ATP-binding protein